MQATWRSSGTWGDSDLVVRLPRALPPDQHGDEPGPGTELAWQERMAESFVAQLRCTAAARRPASARPTSPRTTRSDAAQARTRTGHPERRTKSPGYGGNIRLGTAVTISGAAASPNMGYHSSPLVTVLLTVFNVRLGSWLRQPGPRRHWRQVGPGFACLPVRRAARPDRRAKGQYVYLSDGGHFENLGRLRAGPPPLPVHRRLRRRRRRRASRSTTSATSIRKCRDRLRRADRDRHRPALQAGRRARRQLALRRRADPLRRRRRRARCPGILVYIKPSLTGDEPADVPQLRREHPDVPARVDRRPVLQRVAVRELPPASASTWPEGLPRGRARHRRDTAGRDPLPASQAEVVPPPARRRPQVPGVGRTLHQGPRRAFDATTGSAGSAAGSTPSCTATAVRTT